MRCPDCRKFTGFNTETDPDVNDLEVADDKVTATVEIKNTCSECDMDLKTASLEVSTDLTDKENVEWEKDQNLEDHAGHTLSVEEGDLTRTENTVGAGRAAKKFYGAEVEVALSCGDCDDVKLATVTLKGEVQASAMEDV
jgi:hypothetical protein